MIVRIPKSKENSHQISWFFGRMVLEWREPVHEDVYGVVQGDMDAQQELRVCVLYKIW